MSTVSPMRSRSPLAPKAATWCSTRSSAHRPSPTMACPSPARWSSKIPSRTWAPSSSKRSRPRPTTLPVTAPPRPPCSLRPWSKRASATLPPVPIPWCSSAASRLRSMPRSHQSTSRPCKWPATVKPDRQRCLDFGGGCDGRQDHRRCHRQGRQGRRGHGRGVQHLRHGSRVHRGHAVRQGLPVPVLRH